MSKDDFEATALDDCKNAIASRIVEEYTSE